MTIFVSTFTAWVFIKIREVSCTSGSCYQQLVTVCKFYTTALNSIRKVVFSAIIDKHVIMYICHTYHIMITYCEIRKFGAYMF